MAKYEEMKRLSPDEVRNLCIKKDWYTRGDVNAYATIDFVTVSLGLCLIFSKEMLIVNNFYWQEERRRNAGISTNYAKRG